MDSGQHAGSSQHEENNKRKLPEGPTSWFKVTRICVSDSKQTYELKMIKPDRRSAIDESCITYPTVTLKEDTSDNEYAFHIMHGLNHKNILSLKVVSKNELKSSDTLVATFVEPHDGLLWPHICPNLLGDHVDHIPSGNLQNYLRQIVIGLDFLRQNGLYHGNLSWCSTLYCDNTVKLAGFISKEPMSIEKAQQGDWSGFLKMLEDISDAAKSSSKGSSYFYGNLDSLINMMRTLISLDRISLHTIKETILEQMFFWDLPRRLKFLTHTISLKLGDSNFMEKVRTSDIRQGSWDTECTPRFRTLVERMNDFREAQKKKSQKNQKGKGKAGEDDAYNGHCLKDYVKLVCGGCTHWRQLKLDVDGIIRENHPALYRDIKDILENPDNKDSSKHKTQSDGYGQLGPSSHSQRGYRYPPRAPQNKPKHTAQSGGYGGQLGPSSHSQRGNRYPPRGMPPPQNKPPGGYPEQGPCPPRGAMSWDQRRKTQPYVSQPPSYSPVSGNYNNYAQSQAPGYGRYPHYDGYGIPMYLPRPQQHFVPPPMPPQHNPYAGPSYSGHEQWVTRGVPASFGFYQASPPTLYGLPPQQPPAYQAQPPTLYGLPSQQPPAYQAPPPSGLPSQQPPAYGHTYQPTAWPAGWPAHGQGEYTHPPTNPPNL